MRVAWHLLRDKVAARVGTVASGLLDPRKLYNLALPAAAYFVSIQLDHHEVLTRWTVRMIWVATAILDVVVLFRLFRAIMARKDMSVLAYFPRQALKA